MLPVRSILQVGFPQVLEPVHQRHEAEPGRRDETLPVAEAVVGKAAVEQVARIPPRSNAAQAIYCGEQAFGAEEHTDGINQHNRSQHLAEGGAAPIVP
jgi:hypothetical protein